MTRVSRCNYWMNHSGHLILRCNNFCCPILWFLEYYSHPLVKACTFPSPSWLLRPHVDPESRPSCTMAPLIDRMTFPIGHISTRRLVWGRMLTLPAKPGELAAADVESVLESW